MVRGTAVTPRYSCILEEGGQILYIYLGAQSLDPKSTFQQCYH